jgi:hypothetical protein
LIAIFGVVLSGLFGALILAQGHALNHEEARLSGHTRFDARDRQNIGRWYRDIQQHPPSGFLKSDELTPEQEANLRIGEPLDSGLRAMIQPVPDDLLQRLPPAASGQRYDALDGHLLLRSAKTWNVSDVLHFELDFGRP